MLRNVSQFPLAPVILGIRFSTSLLPLLHPSLPPILSTFPPHAHCPPTQLRAPLAQVLS